MMQAELLEIRDYVHQTTPLDCVEADFLNETVEALTVVYKRRGAVVLEAGSTSDTAYLVRSGALEVRNHKGKMVNRIDAGMWAGFSALVGDGVIDNTTIAIEDSLLYQFPGDIFRSWLVASADIRYFFNKRERVATPSVGTVAKTDIVGTSVQSITARKSLVVGPKESVQAVAEKMANLGRTSALICDQKQLVGIVTEKEFCRKVVAASLDYAAPIASVMTADPITIKPDTPGTVALLTMARHNVHHLPFWLDDENVSTITATDLIQLQSHNPLALINNIHSANTVDTMQRFSERIPELLMRMVQSSMTAYDIGHLISSVGEAIVQRLAVLAESAFGPPPVPYAFVVAGSMARDEQTAHSDQDNGMILSDAYNEAEHGEYFLSVAKFISDGLAACGYIYCPGDVMATNPKWRQTQSVWRSYFSHWIEAPEKKALMYASIFFDMRCVHGDASLMDSLRTEVLDMTKDNQIFLALLSDNALSFRPPLGLFRQFVLERSGEEEKALNLKKRGVVPITDLARVYALASGSPKLHTQDRLLAAGELGEISQEGMADLVDAYEFIGAVRLEHQSKKIGRGEVPSNHVQPEMLSSFERHHLKDAFDVVRTMQKALSNRY